MRAVQDGSLLGMLVRDLTEHQPRRNSSQRRIPRLHGVRPHLVLFGMLRVGAPQPTLTRVWLRRFRNQAMRTARFGSSRHTPARATDMQSPMSKFVSLYIPGVR
jgi:hypothetical protein